MNETVKLLFHSELTEEYTPEQIEQKIAQCATKDKDNWIKTIGNLWQFSGDENYRNQTHTLLRELFSKSYDDIVCHYLDEETYRFIFEKSIETLEQYQDTNPNLSAVLGFLYREARFNLHDSKKTIAYTIKSYEKNSEEGVAAYAFHLFHGISIEANKDKAFDILDTYLATHDSDLCKVIKANLLVTENNTEVAQHILEEVAQKPHSKSVSYSNFLLAELHLAKNSPLALDYYQKAVELDQLAVPFFHLGRHYLYGFDDTIQVDTAKGVALLLKAFERGNALAGLVLGYYYTYKAEKREMERGIELIEHAATYPNYAAKHELACLHLYNDALLAPNKPYAIALLEEIGDSHPNALLELAYQYAIGEIVPMNKAKSIEYIDRALEKNYAEAASFAGYNAENGLLSEDEQPDYEKALAYYLKGGELNNQACLEQLGRYYRLGLAGEPNYEQAIFYNQKAIETYQSTFSLVELAICYEAGLGVEEDYAKAAELYQKAAELNEPYAYYQLGVYHQNGLLTAGEPNYPTAFDYFNTAYDLGYDYAGYNIGLYFLNGYGVEKDSEKGLEILEEQIANQNYKAAVDIALYYEDQEDEENIDWAKVHAYIKLAADENYGFALCKLGDYYYNGLGVEQDVNQAKAYYLRAVENHYPYANLPLGNIELWCEAGDSDADNAFHYYSIAAENNYINHGLGVCYKYGIGTEINESLSVELLLDAAQKNSVYAQYELALSYLNGNGTKANNAKALEWFESAIQYNHITSYYQAGMLLLEGKDVPQDTEKAKNYLEHAAEYDNSDAQVALANMYLIGNGVEENEDYALELFNRAADAGNQEAQKIVGRR